MRALLAYYADAVMAAGGAGCADCNHRGDCMNGTCLCEIRFTGDKCDGPNMSYHGAIGGMFLVVAFVCAVQLTMCIVAEYQRLKGRTLLRACKVTTQKMLYLVTFLAALIRGAYFVSPSSFHEGWTRSLLSAYYPLLMSGSSLIVCFWAEVFHLRDIRWERPRFLSKSFLAFVTFNVINFSLLGAQVLTTFAADSSEQNQTFYQHVFYGCYAVLLLIVVIFFLIYGVEVYFKLHGQFLKVTKVCDVKATRAGPSTAADGDDVQDTLVTKQGIQTDLAEPDGSVDPRSVNTSQLHQSRLGLVSQALMLTLIAAFLVSEILSEFWKAKVPVGSRNWHDVVFRLAEIGVAVWFPCVLWNCMAPETLWLLNPRRLLARQLDDTRLARLAAGPRDIKNLETDSLVESVGSVRECWICYDTSSPEPLIKPCRCTGDVSAVHHDCLVRWLVESASTPDGLKCKICSTPYSVQRTNKVEWERGFTAWHWVQTALVVASMCGAVAGAVGVIQVFPGPVPLVLAGGGAMLYCYVAFTKLSGNTVMAYQRARVFSIKILADRCDGPAQAQLATISKTVTVEIASKAILDQALKGDMK